MEGSAVLRLLVDPDRLAVAGAIAAAPRSTDELTAITGCDRRVVLQTIAALRQAGLVGEAPDGWTIDRQALRDLGRSLAPATLEADAAVGHGMTEDERLVLARFFQGRQLTGIPSARSKRLIVLERLALEFEPGERYSEGQVNEILGAFHEDWAALRRYLVDEGFLDREAGEYWRSGGRVE